MCDYKVTQEDWIMDPKDPAQCPEFDAAANVRAVLTNITEFHRAMWNLYFDRRYVNGGLEAYLVATDAFQRLLVQIPVEAIISSEDQFAKAIIMTNERLGQVIQDSKEFYLLHKPKQEQNSE